MSDDENDLRQNGLPAEDPEKVVLRPFLRYGGRPIQSGQFVDLKRNHRSTSKEGTSLRLYPVET